MTKDQQDTLCVKEKNAVKAILESNQMTMTRNVRDRISILKAIWAEGIVYEAKTEWKE